MRIALYARVSTSDQCTEVQLAPLREYAARQGAEAVEYVDHGISGTRRSRVGLDALLEAVRRGDVQAVAVVRLDRLARSLAHMAALGEELQALGVELVSLSEGLDTSSPTGRAMFGMCGVFAQLERDLIGERTRAGLAAARRRGKRLGRRPALEGEALRRARRMHGAGRSLRQIATVLGCSKSAVARALAA